MEDWWTLQCPCIPPALSPSDTLAYPHIHVPIHTHTYLRVGHDEGLGHVAVPVQKAIILKGQEDELELLFILRLAGGEEEACCVLWMMGRLVDEGSNLRRDRSGGTVVVGEWEEGRRPDGI